MSRANREAVAYIAESTWGVTPSTPVGQLVNFTSTSLSQQNETTNSNFVRADTNIAGNIRTGTSVGGDIGIELQYGAYDDFLAGALRSAWGTATAISETDVSFAASDDSINSVGGDFTDLIVGQAIKVSGAAQAANNGYFIIATKPSANKITVLGASLTDESAGATVVIKSALLKNGNTDKSFTVQRDFQDISQRIAFTGCRVSQMALNFGLKSIAGGSISLLGKEAAASGTSIWSSTTAAATTQSMNTVNDVKGVYIDGVAITSALAGFDFSITTNAEQINKIGQLAATDVNTGSIGVTGTLTEYLEDLSLLDYGFNFTEFRLTVVTEDEAGNGYIFDFPSCRIGAGSPDNGGINSILTSALQFSATLAGDLGYTVGISRFAA
jgi:hypothetical protein